MTIDTEGEEQPNRMVQQDRTVTVNWLRFNIPSLVAILVAAVSVTLYINQIDKGLALETIRATTADANAETVRTARSVYVDGQIAEVKTTLKAFNDIPYKVNANTASIVAQTQQITQMNETLRKTLDSMRDTINELSIKVGIQSDKIENLTAKLADRPQRSRFTVPSPRVAD